MKARKIPISKGKFALVDVEDFEFLNRWKWKFHKDGYAVRTATGNRPVYMHRVVLKTPKGKITDHINRNRLDNRRQNLRVVSLSQNALNTDLWKHNTSGIKGVVWNKNKNKWQAQINIGGKCIYLGLFLKISEAAKARNLIEKNYAL